MKNERNVFIKGLEDSPFRSGRYLKHILNMDNLKYSSETLEAGLYAIYAIVQNPWRGGSEEQIDSAVDILEELITTEKANSEILYDWYNAHLVADAIFKIANVIIAKRPDLTKRLDKILDIYRKDGRVDKIFDKADYMSQHGVSEDGLVIKDPPAQPILRDAYVIYKYGYDIRVRKEYNRDKMVNATKGMIGVAVKKNERD